MESDPRSLIGGYTTRSVLAKQKEVGGEGDSCRSKSAMHVYKEERVSERVTVGRW